MKTKIPVYECKITGTDETGIFAISFVDIPANEHNFISLNKQQPLKLALNKQKQVLTGVVLVPDQLIYRHDEHRGEYYIKFTAQDIEKITQKMMRTGLALNTTTHQHQTPLKGNYLTEIWLVSDSKKDKAAVLGLGELPVGTLVASYKIEDPAYWHSEVMAGKVKGFSLEGIFNFNSITMSKNVNTAAAYSEKQVAAKKNKGVLSFLRSVATMLEGTGTGEEAQNLVDQAAKDETGSGTPFLIFDLADGGELRVAEDGYATLEGEQMPAGEHALGDGNFIVIDDEGMFVNTQAEADSTDPAASPATTEMARQRSKSFLNKGKRTQSDKIARLEHELAQLKMQPSAKKVKALVDAVKGNEMSHTEKMAAIVRNRQKRTK